MSQYDHSIERPAMIEVDDVFNENYNISQPTQRSDRIHFLIVSDTGDASDELHVTAEAMAIYAKESQIDFVCGLGDNFYPHGVESVDDALFETNWANVFLHDSKGKHDRRGLRVPWHMVLGNHDYIADHPHTEVKFTTSQRNQEQYGGLWHMPAPCYHFHSQLTPKNINTFKTKTQTVTQTTPSVEFFVLDTCGCQDHVILSWPELVEQLQRNIAALRVKLMASTARWKFVLGHHLMYTQGFGHADSALVLRQSHEHNQALPSTAYTRRYDEKFGALGCLGFGLEQVLIDGGVTAYFGGHEHVFQHAYRHGIHHFCCGASGADIRPGTGLHRGIANHVERLDWVGTNTDYGFLSVEVTWDRCVVKFHQAKKIVKWYNDDRDKERNNSNNSGNIGIIRSMKIVHEDNVELDNNYKKVNSHHKKKD